MSTSRAIQAGVFRRIEQLLARFTDALCVVSPQQATELSVKFHVAPAHKFHVVPLGLELDDYFALRPPAGTGPLTVGWFGRMVPVKNIALLAATIENALARTSDIRFLIAGDGPDRSALTSLLDWHGGRVEWLGWQSEILPTMARCDVLLQTSRNEGTPVALIQGMAAARPFVSTAVGGVVDMVSGSAACATGGARWYANGVLTESNARTLADALVALTEDRTLIPRMGCAGRALAASRYRKETLVENMDALYRELLNKNGLGRKSMNVLITGGAGFIGSHLAERCLAEGWRVAILDDLSTGAFENIAHLKSKPAFSYRIDSVFNEPVVAEMVDSADIVFHLAAAVGVKQIVNNLVSAIRTNVDGAEVVLRYAAKKGKPVMLASTSEVYGKSTRLPFRENDDLVLGPTKIGRWSYAVSKALDECLGLAYWSEQRLPVTVLRFFNTVGPRQTSRYGMVLPTFVRQALRGEPLTIHGTGEQRRCFSYVGDVVEALVRLAQTPAAVGEVVNIGNDQEVTINAVGRAGQGDHRIAVARGIP